jgi:hypothetical protein
MAEFSKQGDVALLNFLAQVAQEQEVQETTEE